jgi:FkbM family methyltransferase
MLKKLIIKFKGFFPVKIKTYFKKFKTFNGYDGLDKRMLNYINFKNGFYIECGANDGVNQSNTWYFEKKLGWKGLLIEPIDTVFDELKKNRNKRNFFFQRALRPFNYKNKNVELKLDIKDTLSTRSTIDNVDTRVKIQVKSANLNSILNEIEAPKIIDFFSLDVEGDEFQVLKGISFKKYTFRYILVETYELNKLKNYLNKNGYKYVKKMSNRNDHLFKSIKNNLK